MIERYVLDLEEIDKTQVALGQRIRVHGTNGYVEILDEETADPRAGAVL